jgi:hypothetical protein
MTTPERHPPANETLQRTHTPTEHLLFAGGDARIALDAKSGVNKYGCGPTPDPTRVEFSSSTASTISQLGFLAAENLHRRLVLQLETAPSAQVYARELMRLRLELMALGELDTLQGTEIVFAASGTDIHLIAAQLWAAYDPAPLVAVLIDQSETGSGVPAAIAGRHFSSCSPQRKHLEEGAVIGGIKPVGVVTVPLRQANGELRSADELDAAFVFQVKQVLAKGQRVLLVLNDLTKTGAVAPSVSCVMALQRQAPEKMHVLVDACQFRLSPATVKAYLAQGYLVAVTGAKFLGGPPFSGALFIPALTAQMLKKQPLPAALAAYSFRAEWPVGWDKARVLDNGFNFGLLLRWEAALSEWRAFKALSESKIIHFIQTFGAAVQKRFSEDPNFLPLPLAVIDRRALLAVPTWDHLPTIFPFALRKASDGSPLSLEQTRWVYQELAIAHSPEALRCQFGQPVSAGIKEGEPFSALRLCLSARLITEGVQNGQAEIVILRALATLDKAAFLAKRAP